MGSQAAGEELPYIGSKISLITTSDIRYEGETKENNPSASHRPRAVALFRSASSFGAAPFTASFCLFSCILRSISKDNDYKASTSS